MFQAGIILFLVSVLVRSFAAAEAAVAQPPNPPVSSPVAQFRQWLTVSDRERAAALADYPEAKRKVLAAKLDEYAKLPPEERERRLRAIELRLYLRPLMNLAIADRKERLALVPIEYKDLIGQRLSEWDRLDPALRKELLDNEANMQYFERLRLNAQTPPDPLDTRIEQLLNAKLEGWRQKPMAERQRAYEQLNRFFDLPPQEQKKTLDVLSETERRQMEQTLRAFEKLPPVQRRLCIESFQKFGSMAPEERREFLKNAARWQAMSPRERALWRQLVSSLPPMPPVGSGTSVLPPPPPLGTHAPNPVTATSSSSTDPVQAPPKPVH